MAWQRACMRVVAEQKIYCALFLLGIVCGIDDACIDVRRATGRVESRRDLAPRGGNYVMIALLCVSKTGPGITLLAPDLTSPCSLLLTTLSVPALPTISSRSPTLKPLHAASPLFTLFLRLFLDFSPPWRPQRCGTIPPRIPPRQPTF